MNLGLSLLVMPKMIISPHLHEPGLVSAQVPHHPRHPVPVVMALISAEGGGGEAPAKTRRQPRSSMLGEHPAASSHDAAAQACQREHVFFAVCSTYAVTWLR
jgi:hypothetical protein